MNPWLKEGRQSKITGQIQKIASNFSGDDFKKVKNILSWMTGNTKKCRDEKKVLAIFATRTADKVLKDKFTTGCHDEALVFATLCRAAGIPAKYLVGINKTDPRNSGHCAVEIYIDGSWVLVDQSKNVIYLNPARSHFYHWHFIIGTGLDSWDNGIKSFKTWQDKSNKVIQHIAKLKT